MIKNADNAQPNFRFGPANFAITSSLNVFIIFIVCVTETLLLQQTVGASFFSFFPVFLFFAHPSHLDLERTLGT